MVGQVWFQRLSFFLIHMRMMFFSSVPVLSLDRWMNHLALNTSKSTLGFDNGNPRVVRYCAYHVVRTMARGFPLITLASRNDQPGPVNES